MRRLLPVALALAVATGGPVFAAGLSASGNPPPAARGHHQSDDDKGWPGHGIDPADPAACDPIDPAQCMLPYPNDWFTRPDPASATGRRLDLTALGLPHNAAGKPIEPQEWNRSDGFSAGSQILTFVPGMTSNSDIAASGIPPQTDLAMNDTLSVRELGAILLDTDTGRRVPVWGEVDQYTDEAGPVQTGSVQQDLMIHPAVNLADGHHYVIALQHLVTDGDHPLAKPSTAFLAYRDGTATDARAAHMEKVFAALASIGVDRGDLYLAWDFTTASTRNVTGRLLAIRDDAFKQLGDTNLADGKVQGHAPAFTVDSVEQNPYPDIARRISGHFTVPCYLFPTCDPPTKCDQATQGSVDDCPTPSQFALDPTDPDAVPRQTGGETYQANFICNVGKTAFDAHHLMRPVEYGHGLFGGAGEVNSDAQRSMADQHAMTYCATDWTGMASADVPNAVLALSDLSRFPLLTDRVQQGELNFLYLARLMVHPDGFASNPAFQWTHGKPFIDTRQAFYDGNSQGGIYGGTVCAVSVDVRRCVLGVPGMDYSILLPRSSDYVATTSMTQIDPTQVPNDPTGQIGYSDLFDSSYPDQSQRMLILDLIQTLWDRSDPDGYATHMTHGLANTPRHEVLLQVAWGDHQVANITAFTEARTIGAVGLHPPLTDNANRERYGPYVDPFWGIPEPPSLPYEGSGITLFDSGPKTNVTPSGHRGTDPPPVIDVPNRSGDDPHEAPRRAPCGQQQKDAFLSVNGAYTAPCSGAPYFSWGWDGVSGL